jgi:hypothetical protein
MANQHKIAKTRKVIVRVLAVALALIVLSGNLDRVSAQLAHLVTGTATETLAFLPSLVLAGWQAFEPHACDQSGISLLALHMLVSSWPLFRAMAGTA